MKKVYIIHGWGGNPKEGWFPWLKKELESKNYKVFIPEMPNTEEPEIKEWVSYLKKLVKPDNETYFVGHSIGCQTIMRYLESLPEKIKVGKCIFVAGWFNLNSLSEEEIETAKPWLETPIDYKKVLSHTNKITAIFSDNDDYVPLTDSEIFKNKLKTKIIIEQGKGHFSGEDGIKKLEIVLNEFK
ncbi:MAG: DUF1749 domain-containing protein [Candidatus Nanoarchaeia archaeon]|nr:DUF1749 domain-containing protein [Candidatus Nanoarchaeia archaeon]MDD5587797.1 DUF1749 domain-containing protein [Candidatus Nanoarchaeia archaeon]